MTVKDRLQVHLRKSFHPHQEAFIHSPAKRKIIRAGRRGGKTIGCAAKDVIAFANGKRVLYAAPTDDQVGTYWYEVKEALRELIEAKTLYVNETKHIIEVPGSKQRIRAKTAWNADTLRGDYADELTLDEYQLMCEDAWELVGAPMLLDNDGNATFIYTPPSLISSGVSKARDPRHAAKLFKEKQDDASGRWATFHFSSHDNPHISVDALREITKDMSKDSYRREILALDDDDDTSRLVCRQFDERTQLVEPFPIPVEWMRFTGHDFGPANPAALFVAQDFNSNLFVYDEYLPGPGRSTHQHVEEFKAKTAGLIVLKRIGGNQTTEDEIRQGYASHGWPIVAPKWDRINKQLEIVFGLFERNRVFITRNCVNLLTDVRNALWDVDRDGVRIDKIKNESRYHLLSCLRYVISDFTPETVVTEPKSRWE